MVLKKVLQFCLHLEKSDQNEAVHSVIYPISLTSFWRGILSLVPQNEAALWLVPIIDVMIDTCHSWMSFFFFCSSIFSLLFFSSRVFSWFLSFSSFFFVLLEIFFCSSRNFFLKNFFRSSSRFFFFFFLLFKERRRRRRRRRRRKKFQVGLELMTSGSVFTARAISPTLLRIS